MKREAATAYQDYILSEELPWAWCHVRIAAYTVYVFVCPHWWEWTAVGADISSRHAAHPFGDGRNYKAGDIVWSRVEYAFAKLMPAFDAPLV